jgi:hypothetical protein
MKKIDVYCLSQEKLHTIRWKDGRPAHECEPNNWSENLSTYQLVSSSPSVLELILCNSST